MIGTASPVSDFKIGPSVSGTCFCIFICIAPSI